MLTWPTAWRAEQARTIFLLKEEAEALAACNGVLDLSYA